ncbi:MAG: pyruvate dehydrogenase (acetyl-transferring), homodimeric type [Chloroflexi bacterium HGW-Chloroflexi-9]|nr:MAG: pyruvate dehydrogenase (acetyl-transferring), homodimeric type [Chloroflexi bacterium HGW-Chloroflexi-9]
MSDTPASPHEAPSTPDWVETQEWIAALRDVTRSRGADRAHSLLETLQIAAQRLGVTLPVTSRTPYVNTIPLSQQPTYPGNLPVEDRLKSIIRWNALAMVSEANDRFPGIGGHISTYASAATLYEVGFNHLWRGPDHPSGADLIYIQGHASPGIYARAYLEGRLTPAQLHAFRRELSADGLASYPHPWLMPDFWQFPTVSMGLGPLMAIYQARMMRYLEARGLKEPTDQKVWCFLGDGETDEPEALGSISLAAREHLDNLVFVVNCNLQRLDGPVRGNGQIIQELEAVFRGVGWNVIKVLWGGDWDPLLAQDTDGILADRMGDIVDGEYQKYTVAGGDYIRKNFWDADPRLARMAAHLSDEQLWRMRLGGHDTEKVYAAYAAAAAHRGSPTVILARTIKGYGLGEAGEGRNVSHQQKHLNVEELLRFRDRFKVPLSDKEVAEAPLYRPAPDSAEMRYLRARRAALGGSLPQRRVRNGTVEAPSFEPFAEFLAGSGEREASTTMVFVRMLALMMRDPKIGKRVVPIVPDEARTFGMETFFREFGIYSSSGQLYEPVDRENLLFYKELKDGQVLEEGITEAGSFSSFVAAGTSAATYGVTTLPFFIFYSMFGLQRVGDLVWAASDARTRGFLVGATAGRTTLNGEGLQHQDGHSHVLASVVPTLHAYDPAFAYEIVVLIEDGIRRMFVEGEERLVYLTVTNEAYRQPPMPAGDGVREGIVRGIYRFRSMGEARQPRVHLLGSGAILNEVLRAQELLADQFGVASDVWSVTSFTELRRDAIEVERWNLLHPAEPAREPFIAQQLGHGQTVVAASDYLKALPDGLAKWVDARVVALGTDGFGRSDTREALRDFFEVDARHIAFAALSALAREEQVPVSLALRAAEALKIDPERPNPATL